VSTLWEAVPDTRPTQPVSDEYTVEAVCAPVS